MRSTFGTAMMKRSSKILLLVGIAMGIAVGIILVVFLWPNPIKPWEKDPVDSPKIEIVAFADSVLPLDSAHLVVRLEALSSRYPEFFTPSRPDGDWREDLVPYLLDPEVQALYADVVLTQKEKPALRNDVLEKTLQDGFNHYYAHMGGLDCTSCVPKNKRIFTYISRNEPDMVLMGVGDPVRIFIPLDRYLGPEHPVHAREQRYLIKRHEPENAAVEVFKALAESYHIPALPSNPTLLDGMIREAKVILFIQAVLGEDAAKRALGYSKAEMDFMQENEQEIWGLFISERLLFNEGEDLKRKVLWPAPFSKFGTPKDQEIPGKAGVWFGWQILMKYWQENPTISLQTILSNQDANSIFQKSGYRP